MDNFIYTASHDLRAPISNIEGLVIALQRYLGEKSLSQPLPAKLLLLIHTSIDRFKRTLNDLSDITKLQRVTQEDIAFISFSSILEEVQLDLAPLIEQSKAHIEITTGECAVRFSAKNLRSILYNLLSNALKYSSPERIPFIEISCREEEEFIGLTVKDNGLGIDLSDQPIIFAMFKRLHDHVEGSGVGLYIVKKIIDEASGKIAVESEVGKGSVFKVYFKR